MFIEFCVFFNLIKTFLFIILCVDIFKGLLDILQVNQVELVDQVNVINETSSWCFLFLRWLKGIKLIKLREFYIKWMILRGCIFMFFLLHFYRWSMLVGSKRKCWITSKGNLFTWKSFFLFIKGYFLKMKFQLSLL